MTVYLSAPVIYCVVCPYARLSLIANLIVEGKALIGFLL